MYSGINHFILTVTVVTRIPYMRNMTSIEILSIIVCVQDYDNISKSLTELEYRLIQASNVPDIKSHLGDPSLSLVILDNVDVCIAVREASSTIPILMLTEDIDAALDAGADDCLRFHKKLLAKRVQALVNANPFSGYDAIPAMIHSLDNTGKLLYANKYWLETLGYTKQDIIGKNITDFMSETSRQVVPQILKSHWKSGKFNGMAFRFVKKNGDIIDALVNSMSLSPKQRLTVLNNITEMKQVENTLREAQNELESVLNAIPDTITVMNRDGQYIRFVSEDHHRYSAGLENGDEKHLHDVLPNNIANRLLQSIHKTLETQNVQHEEYEIRNDGATVCQHVTISPIDNNKVVFLTRDITQRKLAEENLKTSEKRYRRLFKNATDAIFVIDVMTGKINDASPQASWLLGYPLDELIGMSVDEIESDKVAIQQAIISATQDSNQLIIETQYKHLDGHMIDVQVNSRAIQEDSKLMLISFVRDISEHKRTLAEIEHQRKLAQALLDTANALNASNDLDAVLDTILHNVSHIMPHDSANIMIIEDDIALIIRHLGYDKAGLRSDEITDIQLPLKEADNLRWVENNKQPLKIDDTHNSIYFKWVSNTTSGFVNSLITAPIITNNEVIGFINVDSSQTNNFTEEQTQHLMAFANQAAIAIQQASLVQKLQSYTDQLEKRVSERTRDLLQ